MPKRSRENESKEERWLRKMKRYEDKLKNRQCYQSDEDDDVQNEEHVIYEVVSAEVTDELPRDGVEQISCSEDAVAVNTENAPSPPTPTTESAPIDTNVVVEDVDPELLKALGEFEAEAVEWGTNIQEDVAKRLQHTLQNGLKKEAREELLKKYLFPQNMTFSKAPTLNPEIASMLNEASKNRDKRLLSKQDQIGKALTALGKAMTSLLRKSPDISEVLRIMNDAGKLFADAHYAETETRRSLIIPMVEKSLIDTFKDRKRDNYLFGDKLGDIVKNSRGIKKTGQFIQATSTSTSGTSLNWKGPSSRSRQRPNQPYSNRAGGGQRSQYQYSNRSATRRPPPPPRRQPGAPAPTARRQPYAQAARPPPPPAPQQT